MNKRGDGDSGLSNGGDPPDQDFSDGLLEGGTL